MRTRSKGTRLRARSGAALIEASLVMGLMALVLFGALQVSRLFAAREILDYAAMNGARARAVGFNSFMVHKVVRVSAIPNAGRPIMPDLPAGTSVGLDPTGLRPGALWDAAMRARGSISRRAVIERQRVPFYLAAEHYGELNAILDYADWHTVVHQADTPGDREVRVTVRQLFPVTMPMSRTFIGDDELMLYGGGVGGARMADHAAFYLQ